MTEQDLKKAFMEESSLLKTATQKIYQKFEEQKERLINDKLVEKGFAPISESSLNCRFPRFKICKLGDWEYFFADDGTRQGCFIIAYRFVFGNPINNPLSEDYATAFQVSLEYQSEDFSPVKIM